MLYIYLHRDTESFPMRTQTQDGLLNNYAVEPAVYYAEFPSEYQQQQYLQQGAIALVLLSTLMGMALSLG